MSPHNPERKAINHFSERIGIFLPSLQMLRFMVLILITEGGNTKCCEKLTRIFLDVDLQSVLHAFPTAQLFSLSYIL